MDQSDVSYLVTFVFLFSWLKIKEDKGHREVTSETLLPIILEVGTLGHILLTDPHVPTSKGFLLATAESFEEAESREGYGPAWRREIYLAGHPSRHSLWLKIYPVKISVSSCCRINLDSRKTLLQTTVNCWIAPTSMFLMVPMGAVVPAAVVRQSLSR